MSGFDLSFDDARGFLILRITPAFRDDEAEMVRNRLAAAVTAARRQGALRLLCDNRVNKAFPQSSHEGLWRAVTDNADPADRIALLVANSLAKVRSRVHAKSRAETFASENAAFTWLGAADLAAA